MALFILYCNELPSIQNNYFFFLFDFYSNLQKFINTIKFAVFTSCAIVVGFCIVSNMYTWTHILKALMFPQRKHLQKTISSLETVKSEGFMEALRSEVNFMIDMVSVYFFRIYLKMLF